MTKQDVTNKIEWADKRCTLAGEPLTEIQKEYLTFVFNQHCECTMCGDKHSVHERVAPKVPEDTEALLGLWKIFEEPKLKTPQNKE